MIVVIICDGIQWYSIYLTLLTLLLWLLFVPFPYVGNSVLRRCIIYSYVDICCYGPDWALFDGTLLLHCAITNCIFFPLLADTFMT